MPLSEVLKTALDQIKTIAKTETVFGEPISVGDTTLIPVSKVSIGFAAGGSDNEKSSGNGAGTGGGIHITPLAFISIAHDKIQIHPIDPAEINLKRMLLKTPSIMKTISKYFDKKDDSKHKMKKDEKTQKDSSTPKASSNKESNDI